jgi:general secretion pathway protein B
MSIILDALKKSDTERQRQSTPGIASIPATSTGRSSSRWFWIIGLLLVMNLAAITFLIDRTGENLASPTAVETTPVQSPAAPTPTVPIERPAPAVAVERSETIALNPEPMPATTASSTVRPEPAALIETRQPVTTPSPARPSVTDGLPTFNELRARGVLQLPDLYIDIHVYSDNPAERFIFINMSKYKERARLAEGPVVSEITTDGVILDYLGTAFLLPRE